MITFEEAFARVFTKAKRFEAKAVALHQAVGGVLAENVKAAFPMPPFNKSAMDGYAVRAADVKNVPVALKVEGVILPGKAFAKGIKKGCCAKIMTGAALPRGADCVVMVENTRESEAPRSKAQGIFAEPSEAPSAQRLAAKEGKKKGYVRILKKARRWENVCFKGEDIRKGSIVLKKGTLMRPPEVAIAASVGRMELRVYRKPKVAILNTGDEIIEPGRRRSPGKIYNSNGPMLYSHLIAMGIETEYLGIARDKVKELKASVKKGLASDILILSGGVSMGDYDLVPGVLKACGVKEVFHKVSQKPAKPLFFGTRKGTIVFGVPGNPVSTFFVFCAYIRPAIEKMIGKDAGLPQAERGILRVDFRQKPGRKHFVPARAHRENGTLMVAPVSSYHGSADIASVVKANAFMIVDGDISFVKKGEAVEALLW
ncbi:gephyrin-like molybdotransferase Glp [Verrucomicrobiota bacterium]